MIGEIAAAGLTVVALALVVPVAVLALQVASALGRRAPGIPAAADANAPPRPSVAVLMPAHDEAAGVADAIASVRVQLAATERLLVVADNCSDLTAEVARAAGAEVVERRDVDRRGKGYALDFGVRHLSASPPDVVVIVDADCRVAAGAVDRIARLSAGTARPVQALYLMHAPAGAALHTRIAEFAWTFKNQIRASGFHRLDLPCQLMGSGMAFPWALLVGAPLASGHIVEDLQLGLALAEAGAPPLFCEAALVSSVFPASRTGISTQRRRWEHGHLGVIIEMGPRLLWEGVSRGKPALAAMALDLCVPPLAGLVMAILTTLVLAAALALAGLSTLPLVVMFSALLVLVASIAASWRAVGRTLITASEMASLPSYVLGKVPDYLRWLRRRQTEWIRTERDDGPR